MNAPTLPFDRDAVCPLFGPALSGPPHVFDFSSGNPRTLSFDPRDFAQFQGAVYGELAESGKAWGIGKYGEERRTILRHFPQMIAEGRIYHAGLDITSLPGTPLFAPLDGVVHAWGKEQGMGNYGGFVILKHTAQDVTFYSFYGHLDSHHLVREGQKIGIGERFAVIGDGCDSGGWFTHTHLQILTPKAVEDGRTMQGYVTAADWQKIDEIFPSPFSLFAHSIT
jgi:murein DD-endopeptidase MepM/ murein hydrolase activator NlpD